MPQSCKCPSRAQRNKILGALGQHRSDSPSARCEYYRRRACGTEYPAKSHPLTYQMPSPEVATLPLHHLKGLRLMLGPSVEYNLYIHSALRNGAKRRTDGTSGNTKESHSSWRR